MNIELFIIGMNRYLNALEEMWIGLAHRLEEDGGIEHLLEVKVIVNPILYIDDSMNLSDPNHPCQRFSDDSASENMRRFKHAVYELIPEDHQLHNYAKPLFENSVVLQLTRTMLREFKTFALTVLDSDESSQEE